MAALEDKIDEKQLDRTASLPRIEANGSVQDEDVRPVLTWRSWLPVAAVAVSYAACVYSICMPGTIFSYAAAALGGADKRPWIISGSTIVAAAVGPVIGLAGDYFGRKWILVGLLSVGTVGAGISAGATSMDMLIAGRILASFGICSQFMAIVIPSEVLPRRWRPIAQGCLNISAAFGGIAGFLVPAAVVKNNVGAAGESWRYAFYIEILIVGVAAIAALTLYFPKYRPPPEGLESVSARLMALDPIGSLLWLSFIVPVLTALNYGGNPYSWTSATVLTPLIIGCFMLVLFGGWEWKGTSTGLLHHALFRGHRSIPARVFPIVLFCQAIEGFCFLCFAGFYPLAAAVLWDSDPVGASLRGCAFFFCYPVTGLIIGIYSSKTRNIKDTLIFGFLVFLGGFIGLATTTADSKASSIGFAVMIGVGLSIPTQQLPVVAQLSTPPDLIGAATAIDVTLRSVGGAFGGAIVGSILNNKLTASIPDKIASAALSFPGFNPSALGAVIGSTAGANATALAEAAVAGGITPASIPAFIGACFGGLTAAYEYSLKFVWIATAPFILVALVSVFGFSNLKKELNWLVDHPQEALHHH